MPKHNPLQLGLFDTPRPKIPPPEPQHNNDPALLIFFEDIDGKKTPLELDQWRYKHRNRINDLPSEHRFAVLNYLNKRKEFM